LKPVVRGQNEFDADRALNDPIVQRRAIAEAKRILRSGKLKLVAIPMRNLPNPELYGLRVQLRTRRSGDEGTRREEGGDTEGRDSMKIEEGMIQEEQEQCQVGQGGEQRVVKQEDEDEEDKDGEGEEYFIGGGGGGEGSGACWRRWEEARSFQRKVNVVVNPQSCFFYSGAGAVFGEVVAKADAVTSHCRSFKEPVLRRAVYYISHSRPGFKMNDVSRSGGTQNGTANFAVSAHDAGAYKLMLGRLPSAVVDLALYVYRLVSSTLCTCSPTRSFDDYFQCTGRRSAPAFRIPRS
jgi:hypothetical protein